MISTTWPKLNNDTKFTLQAGVSAERSRPSGGGVKEGWGGGGWGGEALPLDVTSRLVQQFLMSLFVTSRLVQYVSLSVASR